jgi:glycosyltransferase involved in cell wall biosynthesis
VAALIRVLQVQRPEPLHAALRGAFVDVPKAGDRPERSAVEVVGWALGRERPVVAVEFVHHEHVVHRVATGHERSDLAEAFSELPWAREAGFRARLRVLASAADLEIGIRAVLADQVRVPMGSLQLRADANTGTLAVGGELVSVIIPCYNQAHFLGRALESVLAQTYPWIEAVVIDDGSPDNAAEVARRFPGVKVVRQENRGLAGARNAGLEQTLAPYVVFLDADDELDSNALELGLRTLREHPECALVSGSYRIIGADGTVLWTWDRRPIRGRHFEELIRHNYIPTPGAAVYRRSVLERVGGFDETLPVCEDYDLHLRIAKEHPVCSHDITILSYRRHGANMSRRADVMFETTVRVRRRHVPHEASPRLHQAFRDGTAFHRTWYGELLMGEIGQRVRDGRWREALRGFGVLARHDPVAIPSLLRRIARSRRSPFPAPFAS